MPPTYLLYAAPAALALLWAGLKYLTKQQDKNEDNQEEDGQEEGYQLPKLRMRPLKPGVDLEIYTFM